MAELNKECSDILTGYKHIREQVIPDFESICHCMNMLDESTMESFNCVVSEEDPITLSHMHQICSEWNTAIPTQQPSASPSASPTMAPTFASKYIFISYSKTA